MIANVHEPPSALPRRLGFWSSIAIVVGITIGSGIFRTPAVIAGRVPDPMLMLAAWSIGGVIVLCGALSFAELSTSLPYTGGIYVYLREGWGRQVAFLFGWAELTLIRAAALGGISTVFAEYCLRLCGVDPMAYPRTTHQVAALAIAFTAFVNYRGVRLGAMLVGVSTASKYAALGLLVLASFLLGGAHGGSLSHFTANVPVHAGLFGLALISVLWAYDGFADVSFVGGEIASPDRTLPRAIVGGTCAIIAIYLTANAAYLYVIPIDAMARSPLIAADTMAALFGGLGATAVGVVVTISTFGALMASQLVGPRVMFALADDGLLWKPLAKIHPHYQTPHRAILFTGVLGMAFVLVGSFEDLADTFVLAILPFYALSVAAIYRLRRQRPDLHRPYRTPGYPVVPAIFIASTLFILLNALATDPHWTSITFGILLAGIPVYAVLQARGTRHEAPGTKH